MLVRFTFTTNFYCTAQKDTHSHYILSLFSKKKKGKKSSLEINTNAELALWRQLGAFSHTGDGVWTPIADEKFLSVLRSGTDKSHSLHSCAKHLPRIWYLVIWILFNINDKLAHSILLASQNAFYHIAYLTSPKRHQPGNLKHKLSFIFTPETLNNVLPSNF